MTSPSYCVVGGGISGLTAAYRLRMTAGDDAAITLFDPGDRLGGVLRTEVVGGRASGTGERYRIPASLVVSCIGYRTTPISDVPFDERQGRFANDEGRILPGLYCVGWARRGPSGTIGTNKPDGFGVVKLIREDIESGALGSTVRQGRPGFDALAAARGLDVVTFRDWKKIEEAEEKAAREGAPREKFVDSAAMIRARG
mgnify:CR=1 FL=1